MTHRRLPAPGSGQDPLGIYGNAPSITVASGYFLSLEQQAGPARHGSAHHRPPHGDTNNSFDGAYNMQRDLFLRLKLEGFKNTLIWSHWNNDSRLMPIDQMAVVSCDLSGGNVEVVYIGGERLAILGNDIRDAQLSHARQGLAGLQERHKRQQDVRLQCRLGQWPARP